MGWKLKNESTVNANVECTRTLPHLVVRKVGLDVDAIYDCFHHAVRIEIETDSPVCQGEFANVANVLTDEQVRVFTQTYWITPETRQGIILWNEGYYELSYDPDYGDWDESDDDHSNNEDESDHEVDESDDDEEN